LAGRTSSLTTRGTSRGAMKAQPGSQPGSRKGSLTEDDIKAAGLATPSGEAKSDACVLHMPAAAEIMAADDSASMTDGASIPDSTDGLLISGGSFTKSIGVTVHKTRGFFGRMVSGVWDSVMEAMDGFEEMVGDKPKPTAAAKLAVVQNGASTSQPTLTDASGASAASDGRIHLKQETVESLKKQIAVLKAAKAAKAEYEHREGQKKALQAAGEEVSADVKKTAEANGSTSSTHDATASEISV